VLGEITFYRLQPPPPVFLNVAMIVLLLAAAVSWGWIERVPKRKVICSWVLGALLLTGVVAAWSFSNASRPHLLVTFRGRDITDSTFALVGRDKRFHIGPLIVVNGGNVPTSTALMMTLYFASSVTFSPPADAAATTLNWLQSESAEAGFARAFQPAGTPNPLGAREPVILEFFGALPAGTTQTTVMLRIGYGGDAPYHATFTIK
jgi:hypothetical protein